MEAFAQFLPNKGDEDAVQPMTEEELMDNFYGIGQSERGDSQGGYSDKNWEKESQSFIRDMIKTLLPGKTANASEGKSEGGMFSSAEKYAKNFSDNMGDVGKFIRDLVPSIRMTEGNTEMTDSIDNGVGTIAVKKEKEKCLISKCLIIFYQMKNLNL